VGELPPAAIEYVAEQVKGSAEALGEYPRAGRTIKWHRAQIRAAFGYRAATRDDEKRLAKWLAQEDRAG
jgi:hypothetical protein